AVKLVNEISTVIGMSYLQKFRIVTENARKERLFLENIRQRRKRKRSKTINEPKYRFRNTILALRQTTIEAICKYLFIDDAISLLAAIGSVRKDLKPLNYFKVLSL
ncbi:MAG: hypothetical protein MHPSP_002852, partial [Paramarteilia canceri]